MSAAIISEFVPVVHPSRYPQMLSGLVPTSSSPELIDSQGCYLSGKSVPTRQVAACGISMKQIQRSDLCQSVDA